MRLNEVVYTDAEPIEGYGSGYFRIGGQKRDAPLLTWAKGTQPWGGYDDVPMLLALAGDVDVLFLGTGTDIAHIPSDMRAALEGAGIGVEVMSSPAACRTYNVLLSEGRRVALAVLPVA